MNKNKFSSYFIFVSVLTFLVVFASIVQKSYFNFRKPQVLVENNALLKEINPKLDLSVLSAIQSKDKNIDEAFDFSIIKSGVSQTGTPTPPPQQPTIIPTASPSGTLNNITP